MNQIHFSRSTWWCIVQTKRTVICEYRTSGYVLMKILNEYFTMLIDRDIPFSIKHTTIKIASLPNTYIDLGWDSCQRGNFISMPIEMFHDDSVFIIAQLQILSIFFPWSITWSNQLWWFRLVLIYPRAKQTGHHIGQLFFSSIYLQSKTHQFLIGHCCTLFDLRFYYSILPLN